MSFSAYKNFENYLPDEQNCWIRLYCSNKKLKTYPRILDGAATEEGRPVRRATHLPLLLGELLHEGERPRVDGGGGRRGPHPEAAHRSEWSLLQDRGLLHQRLRLLVRRHRRQLHRKIVINKNVSSKNFYYSHNVGLNSIKTLRA